MALGAPSEANESNFEWLSWKYCNGANANATGDGAVATGSGSVANGNNALAVGTNTSATGANDVKALGAGSVTGARLQMLLTGSQLYAINGTECWLIMVNRVERLFSAVGNSTSASTGSICFSMEL